MLRNLRRSVSRLSPEVTHTLKHDDTVVMKALFVTVQIRYININSKGIKLRSNTTYSSNFACIHDRQEVLHQYYSRVYYAIRPSQCFSVIPLQSLQEHFTIIEVGKSMLQDKYLCRTST
jgi:hypothetical protein